MIQVRALLPRQRGHPELSPQVDHHERHEQLDAPKVEAVEEMSYRVGLPPVGTSERYGEARDDCHPERRECCNSEGVDPGRDVGGLAVRYQAFGWQQSEQALPNSVGPHA